MSGTTRPVATWVRRRRLAAKRSTFGAPVDRLAGQAPFFLVLASWLLGRAKFGCLQRQKPAMFAQMPLFVYRHFTGAACTTSSDGRFALFSAASTAAFSVASRLSNSPDILLSDIFRAPHCSGSPVACTRFKGGGVCWGQWLQQANIWRRRTSPRTLAKRLRSIWPYP